MQKQLYLEKKKYDSSFDKYTLNGICDIKKLIHTENMQTFLNEMQWKTVQKMHKKPFAAKIEIM